MPYNQFPGFGVQLIHEGSVRIGPGGELVLKRFYPCFQPGDLILQLFNASHISEYILRRVLKYCIVKIICNNLDK